MLQCSAQEANSVVESGNMEFCSCRTVLSCIDRRNNTGPGKGLAKEHALDGGALGHETTSRPGRVTYDSHEEMA